MRISQAARKFDVPRYQLEYWRKTGLLSPGSEGLTFEDLLKLRFILACKKKKLSLQRIRAYLKLPGIYSAEGEASFQDNLKVLEGAQVVTVEGEDLVQPETRQLFFDYEGRGSAARILPFEKPEGETEELSELEANFQEALSELDLKKVKLILDEILARHPEHLGALIECGNIAFEAEELSHALEYYEKALEINPGCSEALYNIANIYFKQGKNAAAIRAYQNAIELDPDFPEAYYNLALLYYALGYLDRASLLLRNYLDLDPDSEWSEQAEQFLDRINDAIRNKEESSLFPDFQ